MSYRFSDPNPVQLKLAGTIPAAGGSLLFYNYQTTDEKDTWSDRDLSTENANPVPLDSAGRPNTEIWLDGEYTAVLYDGPNGTGNVIWTRDLVPEIPPGASIPDPAGQDGKVPMSDGSQFVLTLIRQVPDGTGQAGYMLVADADGNPIWQPQPEIDIPDPEIVVGAGSFRGGTSDSTTKYLRQWSTDTATATGTPTTTKAVTFPTPFAVGVVPHISIIPHGDTQPGGPVVWNLTAPPTNTGFTVRFDVAEGNTGNVNVVNPIPFGWSADGTVLIT